MADITQQNKVAFAEDLSNKSALRIVSDYKVQIDDVLAKTEDAITKLDANLTQAKTNKLVLMNQKKLLIDIETKLNLAMLPDAKPATAQVTPVVS